MAVKRSSSKNAKNNRTELNEISEEVVVNNQQTEILKDSRRISKWIYVALIVLAGIGLFWYKTNTWPIVAVVGGKPVLRFTLNQQLYKQGGKTILDSIITEQLIKDELDKQNIKLQDGELSKKIGEIEKSLPEGTKLDEILRARGMSREDLEKQLALSIRIEKVVSDKASVSAQEIDSYLKENESYVNGSSSAEKRANVEELLKNTKLQEEINNWIESIRRSAKVWTPDNSWSAVQVTE